MEITVKVNRYVDALKEVTYYLVSVNAREGLLRNDHIDKLLGTSYRDIAFAHGGFVENGNEVYFATREEAEEVRDIIKEMLRSRFEQAMDKELTESFVEWEVLEKNAGVVIIAKDFPDLDGNPVMVVMNEDVYLLQVPGEEKYVALARYREGEANYKAESDEFEHCIMALTDKEIVRVEQDADEIFTWDVLEEISEVYKRFANIRKQYLRVVK
ncbi:MULTISPECIES: hypothetical protein [Aneurinibacillus]|uniref:Uncharacterized protein n=1 Tax=Aneurinibacillus thermoaerophilus TaxID=143495 RepID=A0A1G7X648_ANETH|nr:MULTISPECIES: hypothetical protein [Aneurinibacillus]AMA73218.1 hypothetical protein ACH33_10335 [Aneurinibacillus sp. XH2]MED0674357.1 hypothetical protein [Aneurinibacillus thermoaerophilus]MED0678375.1 hypothetical protein [Aneurinibacillus thermoaerophilus]MED0736100.1 hypothetical protein [Aneurinibacillus thermoaerophilus]MED0756944.1 hypothetical protein [Aneurinibacillus thermoaerophilus]